VIGQAPAAAPAAAVMSAASSLPDLEALGLGWSEGDTTDDISTHPPTITESISGASGNLKPIGTHLIGYGLTSAPSRMIVLGQVTRRLQM